MRPAWTHEELAWLRRVTQDSLERTEAEHASARGLPPLTEEECRDLIHSMLDLASERALDTEECFLFGQLLAQFKMSIEARMLGKKPGRYFVMSEADLERLRLRGE